MAWEACVRVSVRGEVRRVTYGKGPASYEAGRRSEYGMEWGDAPDWFLDGGDVGVCLDAVVVESGDDEGPVQRIEDPSG